MTTATDGSCLGILESRLIEQSGIIGQLRDPVESGLREVRQELRYTNASIDRLFLAILGIGAAQIALPITLIIRTT